jgi:hypothetical protein
MDLIDDVLVLHIASYCDARSMLSLALASKRYGMKPSTDVEVTISTDHDGGKETIKRTWSLMDEAARINVWKHTPEYHYGFDGQVYEKDVTYKMSETITNGSTKLCHLRWIGILDTGISWLGLLHQKAIVHKCRPYSINLAHLISDEDVAFEKRNCRNGITKLELRGPEDNPDLEGPQSSPDNNIESLFRDIATLPQLREIAIAPSYYSDDTQQLDVSRAIWLLSPESKYTTLRISNLNIMYQADIDNLTEAFATSTSITSLCIETLYIGSSVTKIIPFMQSIAKMPKLTYLRLVMVAFNKSSFDSLMNKDGGGGKKDITSIISTLSRVALSAATGVDHAPGVGFTYYLDSHRALQESATLDGLDLLIGDEVNPTMSRYFENDNYSEISNCRTISSSL